AAGRRALRVPRAPPVASPRRPRPRARHLPAARLSGGAARRPPLLLERAVPARGAPQRQPELPRHRRADPPLAPPLRGARGEVPPAEEQPGEAAGVVLVRMHLSSELERTSRTRVKRPRESFGARLRVRRLHADR